MRHIRRHIVGDVSDEKPSGILRNRIALRSSSKRGFHHDPEADQVQSNTLPSIGKQPNDSVAAVVDGKQSLWNQAYGKLAATKPSLVKSFEILVQDDASSVQPKERFSATVIQKRDEMLGKQWPLKFMNHSLRVKEQLQRMTKVIGYAQGFGAVVANIDPVHAGIPWAGINILLTVGHFF